MRLLALLLLPPSLAFAGISNPQALSQIAATHNQTAAEIAAGVTPVNYGYAPGDIRRYGADPTGVADSTTAIQNAINVAEVAEAHGGNWGLVFIPQGTFNVTRTLKISGNYVHVQGVGRWASNIRCNANGMGDVFFVNHNKAGIYGIYFADMSIEVPSGLSSPPNGIDFKDASEGGITRVGIDYAADAVILNGVTLMRITDLQASAGTTAAQYKTGIHFTIKGTSAFTANYENWLSNLNIFNLQTAGVLIGGPTNDLQITSSFIESEPYGILVQNDAGVTQDSVDGLQITGLAVWNSTGDSFTGTSYFGAIPHSGRSTFVQVRNMTIQGAYSFQNLSSSYHIQLLQNGNTNTATQYSNINILGGDWYGASTALVYSTATARSTGFVGGDVNALKKQGTGGPLSLLAGSGTSGSSSSLYWGTSIRNSVGSGLVETTTGVTCSMSRDTTCRATVPSTSAHCGAWAQGSIAYYAACSVRGTTATVTANAPNSATWLIRATQ